MTPSLSSRLPRGAGMYLAATIWGTWALVLNASALPGVYVIALAWIFGTIGLLAALALSGGLASLPALLRNWRVARWAVLIGVLDGFHSAIFLTSYKLAIDEQSSILIPVIRSLSGVCTPLMALFISREERFSPWYLAVGAVATAGALCIVFSRGGEAGASMSPLVLGLVTFSMIMACVITLLARVLAVETATSGTHPWAMLSVQGIAESLALLPILLIYPLVFPFSVPAGALAPTLGLLALVGLTHVTLGWIARLHAVKTISGQHSAIIGYLEPFAGVAISIFAFGEPITRGFVLGSILILAAAAGAQYVALRHSALKRRVTT